MKHYPLFDTAKAHRDDPLPSFLAADKVDLPRQQAEVLQSFREQFEADKGLYRRGVTARELSNPENLDYYKIQRRVNELESKGLIYRLTEIWDGVKRFKIRDNMTVWGLILKQKP